MSFRSAAWLSLTLMLLACYDDDDDTTILVDAGSNSGGTGGTGGAGGKNTSGTGGRPSCPEDKHVDALSAWCDTHKEECEQSLHDLTRMTCGKTCTSSGPCYFINSNACGGTTIHWVVSGDLDSRTYHYDANDKLVGLVRQPSGTPCSTVRDYYGKQCELGAKITPDCDDFDAGTDAN